MLEENKKFVNWFNNLLTHEQKYFRREISLACDVSRVTVYSWLTGNVKIKTPYKRIINNLAGEILFYFNPRVTKLRLRRLEGPIDSDRPSEAMETNAMSVPEAK